MVAYVKLPEGNVKTPCFFPLGGVYANHPKIHGAKVGHDKWV